MTRLTLIFNDKLSSEPAFEAVIVAGSSHAVITVDLLMTSNFPRVLPAISEVIVTRLPSEVAITLNDKFPSFTFVQIPSSQTRVGVMTWFAAVITAEILTAPKQADADNHKGRIKPIFNIEAPKFYLFTSPIQTQSTPCHNIRPFNIGFDDFWFSIPVLYLTRGIGGNATNVKREGWVPHPMLAQPKNPITNKKPKINKLKHKNTTERTINHDIPIKKTLISQKFQ